VSKEEAVHLQHAPIVTAQRGKTHEAAGDCFFFFFSFLFSKIGSARARAPAHGPSIENKKINFKSKENKNQKKERRVLVCGM
jgi:hypothetical protein